MCKKVISIRRQLLQNDISSDIYDVICQYVERGLRVKTLPLNGVISSIFYTVQARAMEPTNKRVLVNHLP